MSELRLRATTVLRNDAMLLARERLCLSQPEAASQAMVGLWSYVRLEKLDYPKRFDGEKILRIATVLGVPVDEIMPESLAGIEVLNKQVRCGVVETRALLDYKGRQSRYILPSPSDTSSHSDERVEEIEKGLRTLTCREREIIKMRYGIGGEGPIYSLEEIAKIFCVTSERVRHVEKRAKKKLEFLLKKKGVA